MIIFKRNAHIEVWELSITNSHTDFSATDICGNNARFVYNQIYVSIRMFRTGLIVLFICKSLNFFPSFIEVLHIHMKEKWKLLSRVQLFATSWTIQSMGFSRQEDLSWVAVPFSRGSSQPRDQTQVSRIGGSFFTSWATRKAQLYIIVFD